MPEIVAAAVPEVLLADTAAATLPGIIASGTGTMAGTTLAGADLLASAATPFIPSGALAQSMAASQYGGLGLAGLDAGAAGMVPFGMQAGLPALMQTGAANPYLSQFANAFSEPMSDLSQYPTYENLAQTDGAQLVEKAEDLAPIEERGRAAGITGINALKDLKTLALNPNLSNLKEFTNENPKTALALALAGLQLMKPKPVKIAPPPSYIRPYTNTRKVSPTANYYTPYSGGSTAERNYFTGGLQAQPIYQAAEGGLASFAVGGPVETMSAMNAVGENLGYPQSQYQTDIYSNPNVQRPQAMNMIAPSGDVAVDAYTGEEKFAEGGNTGGYKYSYDPATMQFTQLSDPTYEAALQALQSNIGGGGLGSIYGTQVTPKVTPKPFTPIVTGGIAQPAVQQTAQAEQAPVNTPAYQTPEQQLGLGNFYDYMNKQLSGMRGQGMAGGGEAHLGGYSDGGRLLRGPGDGVSDSIPASIGNRQPARLADGEFVVPARIVSELGNGSTEAGARKLYAMMDRVQNARKKSVGKNKVAVNSRADKHLPA